VEEIWISIKIFLKLKVLEPSWEDDCMTPSLKIDVKTLTNPETTAYRSDAPV